MTRDAMMLGLLGIALTACQAELTSNSVSDLTVAADSDASVDLAATTPLPVSPRIDSLDGELVRLSPSDGFTLTGPTLPSILIEDGSSQLTPEQQARWLGRCELRAVAGGELVPTLPHYAGPENEASHFHRFEFAPVEFPLRPGWYEFSVDLSDLAPGVRAQSGVRERSGRVFVTRFRPDSYPTVLDSTIHRRARSRYQVELHLSERVFVDSADDIAVFANGLRSDCSLDTEFVADTRMYDPERRPTPRPEPQDRLQLTCTDVLEGNVRIVLSDRVQSTGHDAVRGFDGRSPAEVVVDTTRRVAAIGTDGDPEVRVAISDDW